MTYYTEGYVKGVGIGKGKAPVKVDNICIEVVAPYKMLLRDKEFALFVEGDGKDVALKDDEELNAKIKGASTLESVECKEFDAQFLFLLKQTHSKVRFVFNDELNVLERIVAI